MFQIKHYHLNHAVAGRWMLLGRRPLPIPNPIPFPCDAADCTLASWWYCWTIRLLIIITRQQIVHEWAASSVKWQPGHRIQNYWGQSTELHQSIECWTKVQRCFYKVRNKMDKKGSAIGMEVLTRSMETKNRVPPHVGTTGNDAESSSVASTFLGASPSRITKYFAHDSSRETSPSPYHHP